MQTNAEEPPWVEFIILADHVEVLNGKLYLMGGAWDNIGIQNFRAPLNLNVGFSVVVPWEATNQAHIWSLSVEDDDGRTLAGTSGTVQAGRPPFVEEGASQRVLLAAQMHVHLPAAGAYTVAASVDGGEGRAVMFRAQATAPPQAAARA